MARGIEFQSQVAILGWGYGVIILIIAFVVVFQSQVAILGWGYRTARRSFWQVSIAGGDSWVGIHHDGHAACVLQKVSIAGGDSWVGIRQRIDSRGF